MFARMLRHTLSAFGRRFAHLAAVQALLVAALVMVTVAVAVIARELVVGMMGFLAPEGVAAAERVLMVALGIALAGVLVILPFAVAAVTACIGLVDDVVTGRRSSLLRWCGEGLRRWLSILGTVLLALAVPIALLVMAPILVLVGLIGLAVLGLLWLRRRGSVSVANAPGARLRPWLVLAIPFAPLALALPVALLMVPAAVLEGATPFSAARIARSRATGRGGVIVGLLALALLASSGLATLASWALPLAIDALVAQAISLLVSLLLLPIVFAAMTVAYRDAAGSTDPSDPRAGTARTRRAAGWLRPRPATLGRIAAVAVGSLVIGAGVTPGIAFAAEPEITPTITIVSPATVVHGELAPVQVTVSDLDQISAPSAVVKYWVYQGLPEPDPQLDSVSGWPDGGVRPLSLSTGEAEFDIPSQYLSPGSYSIKVFFKPAIQDSGRYTPAVAEASLTVIPRTLLAVTAPVAAPGTASNISASVSNLDGTDAPTGSVQFRWRPDAGAWSGWSAPAALVDAGSYSTAVLDGGLTLTEMGSYLVQAHYLPDAGFAAAADAETRLIVGARPTMRQLISYDEPHAGAPVTFTVRLEAYGNGPDAVTSIPPTADAYLYLYETDTPSGPPNGAQLASCPPGPPTAVAGEMLVWEYSCTASFSEAGRFGLISGGYPDDGIWEKVYPGGTVYQPSQRFTVGDFIKGTPVISLSAAAGGWVGNQTVPLQWSVSGPSADVDLTLSRDGVPVATLRGTSGTHNVTLPADLGSSADTIDTTFTLEFAGDTMWNAASASLTRGVTACIRAGGGSVTPGGSGSIALATASNCGSGASAGFTPGSVVHWTVTPSDISTITSVRLTGQADASHLTIAGTDVSTIADRSRTLSLDARFEASCVTVMVPLTVLVDEASDCGPATGWTVHLSGGEVVKSNTYLGGTVLHLGYVLPDAMVFSGWSGPIASGSPNDAKVGVRVTNSGIGVKPVFSAVCLPVTLVGTEGRGSVRTMPNCRLPGSSASASDGFRAGTNVQVSVAKIAGPASYISSITVNQQGMAPSRSAFAGYSDGSTSVSTSFVLRAPTTVTWSSSQCVLVQTVGVNANHDRTIAMGNPYLYAHVVTPGCGGYPPRSVGPTGLDNSAYAAIGDTVSIFAASPLGANEKLHFQGWKRSAADPSGFTPPNRAAFQWKVTGPAAFEAVWGQEVSCQPVEVVMVPPRAFSNVSITATQASGCPAGTFDLADALSARSGAATLKVVATPNAAVAPNAVYGIGYSTNSLSGSSSSPVSSAAVAGLSRSIPAFGATTITLHACQAVNAQARVKSPADGGYHEADAPEDFFFVSPAPDCTIGDDFFWSVGSTVDVAAAPEASGYRFTDWQGSAAIVDGTIATVSLNGDRPSVELTARFDIICHTLTSNYHEGVTASPAPNCPGYPASEHRWIEGSIITLSVDEERLRNDMRFVAGWLGAPDAVQGSTAVLTLDGDRAVYADLRANDLGSALARSTSSLAQSYVGVIAGALGGLLLGSNPVTAALGLVNMVLGGVVKLAGALGVSGSVIDALSSAADATQWLTDLITAPMSCVSNWAGGESGGAGSGASTLEGEAGRSIGKAISKEWTRMAKGGERTASATVAGAAKTSLSAFQVMNGWIANLGNDPAQTWGSLGDSFASCMAQSVYPPGH